MVGFAAGAMLTMATAMAGQMAGPPSSPNIYGPLASVAVPADAPPLFVARAADDPFFAKRGRPDRRLEGCQEARRVPPLRAGRTWLRHVSEATANTGWFEASESWMTMHGRMQPAT
ncbi:hypothetical protein LQ953_03235 [Sphingomonas sp. IC-56]|uniref:hypothetical protein n=1 Tax=Sphingomonas sp. IC-56 TaxID=2898529 RepID=UPI001E473671|nr:hypothetical protein [Sphingomonas sp. IC-56]MCD2323028.1 hypothetical protein [Sphingomonas sp. IC-56]